MSNFKPDNKKTTCTLLTKLMKKGAPKVFFTSTALKWISAIVEEHDTEVGFYGAVSLRDDGSYLIDEIFYPKHQLATGGTCEISAEGENNLMSMFIQQDRPYMIERIRMWGHSHVNMGTSPSHQDETQAIDRMISTGSFLIRVIANKKGEMSVSVFDYDEQIKYDNIKWEVEEPYDQRLDREKLDLIMSECQNVPGEKPSDTLDRIRNIIDTDCEYENIVKLVVELKKENIPTNNNEFYTNKDWYDKSTHIRHNGSQYHNTFTDMDQKAFNKYLKKRDQEHQHSSKDSDNKTYYDLSQEDFWRSAI